MEVLQEISMAADAAAYFPPASGRYEMKAGLAPLSTNLGNGEQDGQIFQLDSGFGEYRRVKELARAEKLGKYYQVRDCDPELMATVARFIAGRLVEEHPEKFSLEEGDGEMTLRCGPSGEVLRFDSAMRRVHGEVGAPLYADPLDALAMQVQEDLTVVCRVDDKDWVCAIHLCCPHTWTAEGKIGMDFVTMHAHVPGMNRIRRSGMVNVMVEAQGLARFVWSLSTDRRLNHHPEVPPGVDVDSWQEKHFDPADPRLFLRVEREVLWGFPEHDAALFALRTSFRDCEEIRREAELCEPLCAAIESMNPEMLAFKGLAESRDDILSWLKAGLGDG